MGSRPRSAMSRSRVPNRTAVFALAAIAAVAVAAVVVVLAVTGGGSSTQRRGPLESMFQDDHYLLYQSNPAVVEKTLRTLKALGVDRVRVQVLWVALAPDPLATKPPPGFTGTDPNSYNAAGWAPYDRMVRLTKALGMGVNFDLTAPGPLWAMRQGDPDKATVADYAPSVSRFEQFVTAVARRYSGRYTPAGSHAGPLPRVDSWSIWNEPNQPAWLSPQLRTVAGTRVPDAPAVPRVRERRLQGARRRRARPLDRHGADRGDGPRGVHRARSRMPVPRRRSADRADAVPARDVLRRQQLQAAARIARYRAPLSDQRRPERFV